jgi:bacterioferritin-associated ferredoxin
MYICICNNITDKQIEHAVHNDGICSMRDLCQQLGVASCCGQCHAEAAKVLEESLQQINQHPTAA